MNKGIFIGNIGKDAVIRETNGRKAIGFNVAVNDSYKNSSGTKVEKTTWLSCTIWREGSQSTEIVNYLKSGTKVMVEGQIDIGVYEKDRNHYADLKLKVSNLELLSAKKEEINQDNGQAKPAAAAATTGATSFITEEVDNDLPF